MKITNIYKEKYSGKVYNFHCLPSENYFSHNILVHNCYKDNGEDINTHHMTFNEFKIIFHKVNHNKMLTQIAFGICDINSNSDFFAMMEYSRENGVIPNYTCNGLEVTTEIAEQTAKICGAVAVSLVNKDKSFNAIEKFIKAGMKQVNCHYVLSEETYDKTFDIIDEIVEKLPGFNAIVFLQYKHKNPNSPYHSVLDVEKYKRLINYCNEKKINYGFDSCSAPIFLNSIKAEFLPFDRNSPMAKNEAIKLINSQKKIKEEQLSMMAEPCESGLFSSYINCHGKFFVCSFAEGEDNWQEGIDVLNCNDFLEDVWLHPRLVKWRKKLIENQRNCPIYELSLIGV